MSLLCKCNPMALLHLDLPVMTNVLVFHGPSISRCEWSMSATLVNLTMPYIMHIYINKIKTILQSSQYGYCGFILQYQFDISFRPNIYNVFWLTSFTLFLSSGGWGGSQLCCLCICSCYSRHPTGSSQCACQVQTTVNFMIHFT